VEVGRVDVERGVARRREAGGALVHERGGRERAGVEVGLLAVGGGQRADDGIEDAVVVEVDEHDLVVVVPRAAAHGRGGAGEGQRARRDQVVLRRSLGEARERDVHPVEVVVVVQIAEVRRGGGGTGAGQRGQG